MPMRLTSSGRLQTLRQIAVVTIIILVATSDATTLEEQLENLPCFDPLGVTCTCFALMLGGMELSGTIPTALGSCTGIGALIDLGDNLLTGNIPSELSMLTRAQWIYLPRNSLTGTVPVELSTMTALKTLSVGDNLLTGRIPSSLSALRSLTSLEVSRNSLTGTVPAEFSTLSHMGILQANGNALSGQLPAELGQLTRMSGMDFSWNMLEGSIPPEFTACVSLISLRLGSNRLTGTIPDGFDSLASLSTLSLEANSLTGPIPLAWCDSAAPGKCELVASGNETNSFSCTPLCESGRFPCNTSVQGCGGASHPSSSWHDANTNHRIFLVVQILSGGGGILMMVLCFGKRHLRRVGLLPARMRRAPYVPLPRQAGLNESIELVEIEVAKLSRRDDDEDDNEKLSAAEEERPTLAPLPSITNTTTYMERSEEYGPPQSSVGPVAVSDVVRSFVAARRRYSGESDTSCATSNSGSMAFVDEDHGLGSAANRSSSVTMGENTRVATSAAGQSNSTVNTFHIRDIRLSTLLHSSPVPMIVVDRRLCVMGWSSSLRTVFPAGLCVGALLSGLPFTTDTIKAQVLSAVSTIFVDNDDETHGIMMHLRAQDRSVLLRLASRLTGGDEDRCLVMIGQEVSEGLAGLVHGNAETAQSMSSITMSARLYGDTEAAETMSSAAASCDSNSIDHQFRPISIPGGNLIG